MLRRQGVPLVLELVSFVLARVTAAHEDFALLGHGREVKPLGDQKKRGVDSRVAKAMRQMDDARLQVFRDARFVRVILGAAKDIVDDGELPENSVVCLDVRARIVEIT